MTRHLVPAHHQYFLAKLVFAASALSGVLILNQRHQHNLEIENQTTILHVLDVVVNSF